MKQNLEELRQQIDKLDEKITSLLSKRFDTLKLIAESKFKNNITVIKQPQREQEVLARINLSHHTYIRAVYSHLFCISCNFQEDIIKQLGGG
ncbi:MAG: chorismate mutase [Oscillospiraceae bacterium]|jgi:chorismate mutase|nr:chorismate mutase [Oscillospiraceae bacterium]